MTASCPKKPNIAEISPHLICALCGGYLIDATTIVECLHSFCKTCIVRYLESSKYCPICEVLVHKTRPLQNIRLDHTLQDIVYKLVPGLFQTEMKRRREFYKDSPTVRSAKSRQEQQRHRIIYSADEKFSISLEFCPDGKVRKRSTRRSRRNSKESPDRRYFLCPAAATVALLKKFIKLKFALPENYQVDLFHSQGGLLDHFSLMDVAYIYSWRREGILQLYYSIYKEPDPVPQIAVTEVKEDKEVKHEDNEDNRPSSLFTKAKLLGNHSVDGSIPHNLSPLELIATVANDISIQEGRGLKRKTEEAQLYEQEEETTEEIQIQKSIEHAIDLCSNNSTNSTAETKTTPTTHDHLKAVSKMSVTSTASETSQSTVQTKPVVVTTAMNIVQTTAKNKEKPKTTDTASQCDPKPKKYRTETSNTVPHSRSPAKNTKPDNTVKDDTKQAVDKAKPKDETSNKVDKVKVNGNNNVDLAGTVTKPLDKLTKDINASQTTGVTGKQQHEQSERTLVQQTQKNVTVKTEVPATAVTQLNGYTNATDVTKQQVNKAKQVDAKD